MRYVQCLRGSQLGIDGGDLDLVLEPAGFEEFGELADGASPLRMATQPDLCVEVAVLSDVIATGGCGQSPLCEVHVASPVSARIRWLT